MFENKIVPSLKEDILRKYNFFELYPFDGGGSFIHQKYIRTTHDFEAAKNILNGAMDEFGPLDKIDFACFERWSTIEKSCWVNRMYFIVPLAKYAALKGDDNVAELIFSILEYFYDNYPAPQNIEEACAHYKRVLYERDNGYNAHGPEYDAPVEYIWFDFQVASRIIHISYALWFLRNNSLLTKERKTKFFELLKIHARTIFYVENFCAPPAPGNHQALRALALLYSCEIFKEDTESANWLPVALNLCQYHILNDFLPDGMLIDLSPSYLFFESWIIRDMLIISERNNWNFSKEVYKRANAAFKVCHLVRQPDGLSPVINDGYALDMAPFLESIPKVNTEERTVLADSKIAIWKNQKDFLLFDCSPLTSKLAHYHAGKMSPILVVDGKPFIVDGGTCNYDDPEFSLYYKRSAAHSSLIINGNDESVLQGRYTWLVAPEIKLNDWKNDTISACLQSSAPGWEDVIWQRSITASSCNVTIEDVVTSNREINMTFQILLHKNVEAERIGNDLLLKHGNTTLRMTSTLPFAISGGQGFLNFQQVAQLKIVFNAVSCGGTFKIEFIKL